MTKNLFEQTVLELFKELDRKYWDLCKDVADVRAHVAENSLELRHVRIDAEGAMNGVRIINKQLDQPKEDTPVEVNVTADTESLTAYVHRLETLINEIEKKQTEGFAALDRARARGDDAMHDLVTRTANSLYAEIKRLEPAPQRDTSWHAHDAKTYETCPSFDTERIVVMRRDGVIQRPWKGTELYWDENGDDTIIAWRYAKEGE
jgi:hypothetical protein